VVDEDGIASHADAAHRLQPAQQAEPPKPACAPAWASWATPCSRRAASRWQLSQPWFVPSSAINALRRDAIAAHEAARLASWERPERARAAEPPPTYPEAQLSYLANVYNEKARAFYHKHGVQLIAAAYEAHEEPGEVSLMITKHCLRFSFNLCPKQAKGVQGVQGQVRAEPMTLVSGDERYTLKFDCKPCEMHIIGAMKPHILARRRHRPFPTARWCSTATRPRA
jgi:hypothetical protein